MAAVVSCTILEAIIAIGINNARLCNSQMRAKRIAEGIFDNDFQSCMDKSNDDIDDDLKTWSSLTVGNGWIRLQSVYKKRAKAFSQWVKDKENEDPQNEAFDVDLTQDLLRRIKLTIHLWKKWKHYQI